MSNFKLKNLYESVEHEMYTPAEVSLEDFYDACDKTDNYRKYLDMVCNDAASLESIIALTDKNVGIESSVNVDVVSASFNAIMEKYGLSISTEDDDSNTKVHDKDKAETANQGFMGKLAGKAKIGLKKLLDILRKALSKLGKFMDTVVMKIFSYVISQSAVLSRLIKTLQTHINISRNEYPETDFMTVALPVTVHDKININEDGLGSTFLNWLKNLYGFFKETKQIVKDLSDLWVSYENKPHDEAMFHKEKTLLEQYDKKREMLKDIEYNEGGDYYLQPSFNFAYDKQHYLPVKATKAEIKKLTDFFINELKYTREMEFYSRTKSKDLAEYDLTKKDDDGVMIGAKQGHFIRNHTRRISYIMYMFSSMKEYYTFFFNNVNFTGANIMKVYKLGRYKHA